MSPFRTGALVSSVLVVLATVGCQAYAPEPYTFHSTFERGRAHENTGCDGCHILGAQHQTARGAELATPGPDGWVTKLEPACALCHPFHGQLADPPDRDECNDPGVPVYETERCRYFRAHATPQDGCQGSGCHSIEDASFAIFSQPVDTSDTAAPTPPPNPHDQAPLNTVFPLQGAHAGLACGNALCHPNGTGDTTDVQGKSQYCASCHTRVDEVASAPQLHYVPERAGWTDDRERDCMACHTTPNTDGTMVWPNAWTETTNNHAFLTPHNTVEDWRIDPPVPRGEPAWKRQCWSCHNVWSLSQPTNPTDTQDGTSQDTWPTNVSLEFNPANMQRGNCTDGCHTTIAGNAPINHFGAQTCWAAGCHVQVGPDDNPFN